VVLYLLKVNRGIHGYELMGLFGEYAISASDLDSAAIYRTLRQLEADGLVLSEWDTAGGGSPRRRYTLTSDGELRFDAWIKQLDRLSKALSDFVGFAGTAVR
jgi:DNA-binding PadR family transcriptional regulator